MHEMHYGNDTDKMRTAASNYNRCALSLPLVCDVTKKNILVFYCINRRRPNETNDKKKQRRKIRLKTVDDKLVSFVLWI